MRRQGKSMLHERDASAFDRVCDQCLRAVLYSLETGKGIFNLAKVVAVTAGDVPPEALEPPLQVSQINDLGDPLIGLDLVVIHDHDQPTQSLLSGRLERFEALPFLQFPIACHHENAS